MHSPAIRVLIADESALLRRDVRRAIARCGAAGIHDFGTGSEVLSVLPAVRRAVIIIGRRLDDMSGYDLARDVRARGDYRTYPIIHLSPAGQLEDLMMAVDSGIEAFVVLPFKPANLRDKVGAALSRASESERRAASVDPPDGRGPAGAQ